MIEKLPTHTYVSESQITDKINEIIEALNTYETHTHMTIDSYNQTDYDHGFRSSVPRFE